MTDGQEPGIQLPVSGQGKGWCIIPPHVVQADLPWAAKVLYGRINYLQDPDGERGCWATNAWLAQDIGMGERTVSRHVTSLVEEGYLAAKTTYRLDPHTGKPKPERRLYVSDTAPAVDAETGVDAKSGEHGDARNGEGGSPEMASTENGRKPGPEQGKVPNPVDASSGDQLVEGLEEVTSRSSSGVETPAVGGAHEKEQRAGRGTDGTDPTEGSGNPPQERDCPSCGEKTLLHSGPCPSCRVADVAIES